MPIELPSAPRPRRSERPVGLLWGALLLLLLAGAAWYFLHTPQSTAPLAPDGGQRPAVESSAAGRGTSVPGPELRQPVRPPGSATPARLPAPVPVPTPQAGGAPQRIAPPTEQDSTVHPVAPVQPLPGPESGAVSPDSGILGDLASPGRIMQDMARHLASRYRPAPDGGEGALDLPLTDFIDRYDPKDLPQGMVYAVSPGALRLMYLLLGERFAEVVAREAERTLPVEQRGDYLRQVAAWTRGVAGCNAAVQEGRPEAARPLNEADCRTALDWLRRVTDPAVQPALERTATELLERLAGSVARQGAAARDAARVTETDLAAGEPQEAARP